VYRSFPDIEAVKRWMRLNQLSRRNLDKDERERWIKELKEEFPDMTQREIAQAVGTSKSDVNRILNQNLSHLGHSPSIKSTSAAEELEAKQREIERLRAEKEALADRERKESQARMKAEGERLSLQNQLDGMVEMVKKEQSRRSNNHPPDVEEELETSPRKQRIAAALEEAKKPQLRGVAGAEGRGERGIRTPSRSRSRTEELRKQYEDEHALKAKKRSSKRTLRDSGPKATTSGRRNVSVAVGLCSRTRTATERIKAMANRNTHVEHLDESERLFMAMVAARNDGMNTVREARGLNAEHAGLRVVK
jgi:hypothetical protein